MTNDEAHWTSDHPDDCEDSTQELGSTAYADLRRIAQALFGRERPGVTLQPTALVHEAYMNLSAQENQTWESRAHFLATASNAMRRVLVDAARARGANKRGAAWKRVTLLDEATDEPEFELLDLDNALRG